MGESVAAAVAPAAPVASPATARRRWDLLLACMAVFIATAVGRVHDLFPILSVFKPAMVSTALGIGLLLLQQRGARSIMLLRSRLTTCMLGLIAWGGLSVATALNQGVAFHAWTSYAQTIVMALVIAASVRGMQDLVRLVLVYFVATVLYTAVVLLRFDLGPDNWRLGRLYYYDANDFATLIVTAMPLGLYFVLAHRRLVLRLVALAGLGLLSVGQIWSGSRGGFLALLAVVAFVLLRFTTVPARTRLAGLLVILTIAVGASSDQYWTQMQTMIHPKEDYNLTSEEGRTRIWKRGIGYMAASPITGVGLANFQVAEGTISTLARRAQPGRGVRWGAAHNSFVQIGAETGIPGLLLFVGCIGFAFALLRRVARRALYATPPRKDISRMAQTLMASLVGFVVGAFFLSLAYADVTYTLAALSLALAKVARLELARTS